MVIRRLLASALFFLALLPRMALCEPKFYAEVHPNFGTMDDAYIYSVIVENADDLSGPPLLSGGVDFDLSLIGPQTSVRIINGSVSRKQIYNYQLIPKREGILTTPSAEITAGGTKLTAEALSITVKGARTVDSPAQSGQGKEFFMRQTLDTSERVYVGQQIAHTLEIFTKVTILDPQLGDFTFPDFRNDPIGEQETGARYVNGTQYTVTVLRRALFPLSGGSKELPARELRAKVRERGAHSNTFPFDTLDPFDPGFADDFFNRGRLVPVTLKSNPLKIEVDPLPPPPADLPLLGLDAAPVGPTTIKAEYDPAAIKFGETKTVTVTISSAGLIHSLKGLGTKSTPEYKVYEETPQAGSSVQGNRLWTTKKVKLSIVPLGGGTISVPAFGIGYFDPVTRSYALAKTDPVTFEVRGAPPPPTAAPEKSEAVKGAAPPPLQPPTESPTPNPLTYREPTFLENTARMISLPLALLFLGGLLGLAGAVWIGLRIRAAFAPRRALGAAVTGSRTIDDLASAVRTIMQQRIPGLPVHFSRDELRRRISNGDLLYSIESLLDNCDSALFGGKQISLDELKREALALLKKL